MARTKKADAAALVAAAITDPKKAAAAAATIQQPRPGERRGAYLSRMRQEKGLSQGALAKATQGKGGRVASLANVATAEAHGSATANDADLWRTLALALDLPETALLDVPVDFHDEHVTDDRPLPGEARGPYLQRLMDLRGMDLEAVADTLLLDKDDIVLWRAVEQPWKLIYDDTQIWEALAAALDVTVEQILSTPVHPDPEPMLPPAEADTATTPLPGEDRGYYLSRMLALRDMDTQTLADIALIDAAIIQVAIDTPELLAGPDDADMWQTFATILDVPADAFLNVPVATPEPPADTEEPANDGTEPPPPPSLSDLPANGSLLSLTVDQIQPQNYRRTFRTESLTEMAESLAVQGQLQPVVVRPGAGIYMLVAGERRWRAAQLGMEKGILPADFRLNAIIRTDIDDSTHILASLVENLQREDVPPLEEAEGFRAARLTYSATEIAKAVSKTPRYVQQRLALAEKLTDEAKQLLADETITVTWARLLTRVGPATQAALLRKIDNGNIRSTKDLEQQIQRATFDPDKALFSLLLYNGSTFADEDGKLWFTDPEKVKALQMEAIKIRSAEYREQGYGYVATVEGYFSTSEWSLREKNLTIRKGDAPLGKGAQKAVVLNLKDDLSVEIHANLVRTDKAPTSASAKAAAAGKPVDPVDLMSEPQRLYAEKARTRALQGAIMRDEQAQLAVVAIGMLQTARWDNAISFRDESWHPNRLTVAPGLTDQLAEMAETYPGLLADLSATPRGGLDDKTPGTHPQAALWHILMNMEYSDLLAFIGLLAAARVMSGNNGMEAGDRDLCVAMADTLNIEMSVKWQIDGHYLKTLKKPQLVTLANAIGMFTLARQVTNKPNSSKGSFSTQTMAVMITAILDYVKTNNIRYVPAELRFLTRKETEARVRAEMGQDAPVSWTEDGPADHPTAPVKMPATATIPDPDDEDATDGADEFTEAA